METIHIISAKDDRLTGEVRLRIQDAAVLMLAENRIKGLEGDEDHAGAPFVLAEEVQLQLRRLSSDPLTREEVERALLEDSHFISRHQHGALLFFLRSA